MTNRNILICFLLLFIGISSSVVAQNISEKNNIIKINPLLIGHYQISYERIVKDKNSISLSGAYSTTTDYLYRAKNDENRTKTVASKHWKLFVEYRFYFKNAPNSYFLGTFGRYSRGEEDVKARTNTQSYYHTRTNNSLAIGMVFGRQYLLGKNFTFDWYVGGLGEHLRRTNLKFTNSSITREQYEEEFLDGTKLNRWRPNIRLGLSFGYLF